MYFPSRSASLGGKSGVSRTRQKSEILRAKTDACMGQSLLVSGVSGLQSRHGADEQVAKRVLVKATNGRTTDKPPCRRFHLFGLYKGSPAVARELETGRPALPQPNAESIFQRADASAQRGVIHAGLTGSAIQRAVLGGGEENLISSHETGGTAPAMVSVGLGGLIDFMLSVRI
jgi:hypothetical protein